MPKHLTRLCHASRAPVAKTINSSHVWISDELLSNTFAGFARCQRRHGSNVPGPLEAQRRAKGRRATTATHAPAVPSADIAALRAAKPQGGWWKTNDDTKGSRGVLRWGLGLLNVPIYRQPQKLAREQEIEHGKPDAEGLGLSYGQRLLLKKHISIRKTHCRLVELLKEMKIDLIHDDLASQLPLKIMLENNWEIAEIKRFLLDPRTNPAGARNHLRLLQPGFADPRILRDLITHNVFARALTLGLIQAADLKSFLVNAINIDESCLPENYDPVRFCNELLKALKLSDVLRENDLDTDAREQLFTLVKQKPFCPSTADTLFNLGPLRRDALETCLRMITKDNLHNMHILLDCFQHNRPRIPIYRRVMEITRKFCDEASEAGHAEIDLGDSKHRGEIQRAEHRFRQGLLGRAMQGTPPEVILRTGLNQHKRALGHKEYLERLPRSDDNNIDLDREPTRLEVMYAFLALIGHKHGFVADDLLDLVKEGQISDSKDARKELLISLWVVTCLDVRTSSDQRPTRRNTLDQDSSEELHNTLNELMRRNFESYNQQQPQDLVANVLNTLRAMPLPAKNKLFRRIHAFTAGAIEPRRGYHDLLDKLDKLNGFDLSLLVEDRSYYVVNYHFPRLLRHIMESMNDNLSRFEQQVLTLINNFPGRASFVLTRVLPYNEALLEAFRQSKDRSSFEPLNRGRVRFGGYTDQQLVGMFDKFAWACATTEQSSARNAYRHTLWFFEFLVDQRAPISGALLTALWHAGAVRSKNPSYAVLKELQGIVEAHGGREMTKRFLRATTRIKDTKRNSVKAEDVVESQKCDAAVTVPVKHEEQLADDSLFHSPFFGQPDVVVAPARDQLYRTVFPRRGSRRSGA